MHSKPPIRLTGVRQNNLKNLNVEIPARQFTVITGLSGSGKSSLAFDTLYAEGQRRYVESLSTYTRQFLEKMPKPDLDKVENIPPAIALEQKNSVFNSRSTVGTQTELVDYLRLLFAKVGRTYCIDCGILVRRLDAGALGDWLFKDLAGKKALILAPLILENAPTKSTAKTKASKGSKKTPESKKTSPSVLPGLNPQSLVDVLKEQGYRRLYSATTHVVYDLDEDTSILSAAFWADPKLYVVVDRIKVSAEADAETRTRIIDSIDQAVSMGKGRVAFADLDAEKVHSFSTEFACTKCGRVHRVPEPHFFSFNSPIGACAKCSGFGFTLELDESLIVPDASKTIKNGAIDPFSKPSFADWQKALFRFCERHEISIGKRYRELTAGERKLLWNGDPADDSFAGIYACFDEMKKWKYKLHIRVFIRRYQSQNICPDCHGSRLTPDALAVKVMDLNLPQVLDLSISRAGEWIQNIELTASEKKTAAEIFSQVSRRLKFLDEVGVGYLTLARQARTLSGGESQRINLATQLGNGLCGTLYVLDEPSIGLHAADTARLIGVLQRLRDQGNTVVVVEHDLEVIRAANHLVELGPGAGRRGGEIVASGTPMELEQAAGSLTGKYLSGVFNLEAGRRHRPDATKFIKITGCRENNLKKIDVEIPLERLVVVSGMSGSGKSTLVHKTIHQALARVFYNAVEPSGKFDRLYGAEQLSGVVLLDQSPIGKSSRSNPATYLKAWDEVRRIFANQPLALRRGYTPQYFSFNVDGGRCPVCKGEGEVSIDMHFMAEIRLPCEECEGRRFKKNVLEVAYRGKNVTELLQTTIDEAYELFMDHSILRRKFGLLREVGLGYLQVGQSGTTLSGGEAQRLKIASTLDEQNRKNLLYVFDEPTTGLHLEDVKRLMEVIQGLVDDRNSVLMIEHHLDVIAQADWLIDLGPGGGELGGDLVAAGAPSKIIHEPGSVTGEMLRKYGYQFEVRPA